MIIIDHYLCNCDTLHKFNAVEIKQKERNMIKTHFFVYLNSYRTLKTLSDCVHI